MGVTTLPSSPTKIKTPSNVSVSSSNNSKNQRQKIFTITDNSNITGKKTISFTVEGIKEPLSYSYEAKKRPKPSISIPDEIEKNVMDENTVSIVAKNGCSKVIRAYNEKIHDSCLLKTFTNLNISNTENIIPNNQIREFYNILATQLSCGLHKIHFKRDNEPNSEVVSKIIRIIPTEHKFKITEIGEDINLTEYKTIQNKNQNKLLQATFVKTKELITPPQFVIENSTHGKIGENNLPTKQLVDNKDWTITQESDYSTTFTVGTYYPGEYIIRIKDKDNTCDIKSFEFKAEIETNHKQYYDEIFVRGEDSTSFDYNYLVALEGDSITEPIYVNTVSMGASYKDIKICTTEENITGLAQIDFITFNIKNTSERDIENLILELNPLIKDEDDNFIVTSNEWLESDGIFYNFKENFETINKNFNDIISVKNLSEDNDEIDEEDVCLHINKLKAKEDIQVKIPFGCSIEKEVYLQVLLFGQPMVLYSLGSCSDETKTFNKILTKVYDSVLTNMEIIGENDLFETYESPSCPNECFKTQMEYKIQNIDSNELEKSPKTIITNDPRLVPYKLEYNDKTYNIVENNIEDTNGEIKYSTVTYENGEAQRSSIISGARIDAYVQFENHEEIHLHQYTDYNGETTFFITIPKTVGGTFTVEDLLKHMSIEFNGNEYYNAKKYSSEETEYYIDVENGVGNIQIPSLPAGQYMVSLTKDGTIVLDKKILIVKKPDNSIIDENKYTIIEDYSSTNASLTLNSPIENEIPIIEVNSLEDGEYIVKIDDSLYKDDKTRPIKFYPSKNTVDIQVFKNKMSYIAGQTCPISIKIIGKIKYLQNNLVFYPKINSAGDKDSLIVYYQICNLDKNKGKLTTTFKTDDYRLITNEVSEKIYCGMDTNLTLYTRLSKLVLENKSLNRLHIALENKERNNKDIEVIIEEERPIEKYDMIGFNVDKGTITINENKIIWNIDYIEEDTTIRGYIDFKAKEIGYSTMKTSVTDFIERKDPKPLFGEASYKCDCRKVR